MVDVQHFSCWLVKSVGMSVGISVGMSVGIMSVGMSVGLSSIKNIENYAWLFLNCSIRLKAE